MGSSDRFAVYLQLRFDFIKKCGCPFRAAAFFLFLYMENNLNLQGRYAWVGGGSKGIGLAIAQQLAEAGATVVLFARHEEQLQHAIRTLGTPLNQTHDYRVVDFSQLDSLPDLVASWQRDYPLVSILVNNSGGPSGGQLLDESPAKLAQVFSQHVLASQIWVQSVLPGMKVDGFGRIINIISVSVRQPIAGLGVSNTVRAAMAAWSKTLSREVGPWGITINSILPGFTATGRLKEVNQMRATLQNKSVDEVESELISQVPIGRFVRPEEVASLAVYLCSPLAGAVTGSAIAVDGGYLTTL